MKYSLIWKKILVIWIAVGIAFSGYFYIFPIEEIIYGNLSNAQDNPRYLVKEKYPLDKICFLTTVVGAILIGGLGVASKQKE